MTIFVAGWLHCLTCYAAAAAAAALCPAVPCSKRGLLLLDSTPDYSHIPMAACRIRTALPSTRLIILLRDPVQRAFSAWNMVAARRGDEDSEGQPPPLNPLLSFTEEASQLVITSHLSEPLRYLAGFWPGLRCVGPRSWCLGPE